MRASTASRWTAGRRPTVAGAPFEEAEHRRDVAAVEGDERLRVTGRVAHEQIVIGVESGSHHPFLADESEM
jgi:hypothetical protein